jgi:hypothetical protein
MALAAVLIDALHAALEDGIVAFDSVGGDHLSTFVAAVFVIGVVHAVMAGVVTVFVEVLIPARSVGHDGGFFRDVGANDWHESADSGSVHMPATSRATALLDDIADFIPAKTRPKRPAKPKGLRRSPYATRIEKVVKRLGTFTIAVPVPGIDTKSAPGAPWC